MASGPEVRLSRRPQPAQSYSATQYAAAMQLEMRILATAFAATAAVGLPASASAAVSAVPAPLAPVEAAAQVTSVAVGDGTVVWTERTVAGDPTDPAATSTYAIRTTDGSAARTVTQVTVTGSPVPELEVGRTAGGDGVVAVTVRVGERSTIELVRLSDGRRTTLPSRVRGGVLRGVAIDRGWLYATRATGSFAKRKATLWRARISGLEVGAYTRVRSAGRTEDWSRIVADRNRVAVLTTRGIRRGAAFAEDSWLAGTPRGTWVRRGVNLATDGGYSPVVVAGFSADGKSVVTAQRRGYELDPTTVQEVALRGAAKPRAFRVVLPVQTAAEAIAFDGGSGRLIAAGPDASGTPVIGRVTPPWGRVRR